MTEQLLARLTMDFILLAFAALFTSVPVLMIRKAWRNWNRLLDRAGEHAFRTARAGSGEAWTD